MTETSAATLPTTVSKGDTSVSESVDATEISDCSLDVMAPSGTPLSKMFSCCLPKATEEDEEEDEKHEFEEIIDDEGAGIEVDELMNERVVQKTREIEVEEEPVAEAPSKFAIGKAMMSFAVVGATVGAVVANGLAQGL
mmetsp:Transcript_128010/g.190718  ORF Transcript_128010/g.190718 Transcript_128010/m.190718 type:complete len:139 (-) Transcript_128010:267-683(-)|eukprot:CAMPEP_0117036584 /NCGR_PEP_ID=MMETSP0472-20121206/25902_1 /TAXON_ID=693140 ORGANISM="Tiarina fusus, Strain LIS" /NCGR_SAMPLE_ID=MMETSP0472 /ASSEMBLY_ACC=CAM_ASM_000603 /LENGTH=138 /DNA_ID=CAMNT_0004746375 /DNA_START=110 /DNA_END=526 /DNA_ORIENTATION=-